MAVSIAYLDDGGVFLKGTGRLEYEDIENVNRIMYETKSKIEGIRYQLADYSEVEEIVLHTDDVIRLAKRDAEAAKVNPHMFIAVVGGQNDLIYGLLRMWEIYAETPSVQTQTFRCLEDAKKWISKKFESAPSLTDASLSTCPFP